MSGVLGASASGSEGKGSEYGYLMNGCPNTDDSVGQLEDPSGDVTDDVGDLLLAVLPVSGSYSTFLDEGAQDNDRLQLAVVLEDAQNHVLIELVLTDVHEEQLPAGTDQDLGVSSVVSGSSNAVGEVDIDRLLFEEDEPPDVQDAGFDTRDLLLAQPDVVVTTGQLHLDGRPHAGLSVHGAILSVNPTDQDFHTIQ